MWGAAEPGAALDAPHGPSWLRMSFGSGHVGAVSAAGEGQQATRWEGKLPRGADGLRAPIAVEDKRSDKRPLHPPPPQQGRSRGP